MKSCLSIILVLNLLTIASVQASEGRIVAKSRALFEVISAVEAARYDLPVSYEIRDLNNTPATEECSEVVSSEVVSVFEEMLESYQSVFPDDELPYSEAIEDFKALVGPSNYNHCKAYAHATGELVVVESFKSLSSSFKVTFLHHQFQ